MPDRTMPGMRRIHEAFGSVETYSPAEERFNRRRRTTGLVAGPVLFLTVLLAPLPSLEPAAHHLAAVLALVVTFWVTEALPLAVTAVLGPVLAVILQVAPARSTLAPFADPIIFLFIGSFMLAESMFVHGLDRRIAFTALSSRFVRGSAPRILATYGATAAVLSMWMSNTATTAMLFPIGLAIVAHLGGARSSVRGDDIRRFGLAMMLMTSFAASVGGLGTPVGTPPNLIGIGMLERTTQIEIGFAQWMVLGLPVVGVLFVLLTLYFHLTAVRGIAAAPDSVVLVREELRKLGPLSRPQRNVLIAFAVTVFLWLVPGVFTLVGLDSTPLSRAYGQAMPESIAAMIGAILLFVLPTDWRRRRFTLTWEEAVRIDWGIILLFGGGLALGDLTFQTGLAEAMGRGLTAWLPAQSGLTLTILFTGFAILMSEAASNTASATMVVPVAIAVAQAAGIRPIEPALGATLGASMGFMMPISTPPNAIVYSSGYIPITVMMRFGLLLDLAAFVVIVVAVMLLGPVLF